MKLFVLALALIAAVSANQIIHKRVTTLLQEGYSVDNVVNLLVALARVNGDNLQTLVDNWAQAEAVLTSNIDTLEELLTQQQQSCNEIDATIGQITEEVKRYKKYIKEAQRNIKQNLETLAERREKRCARNLIFVDKLKDSHDAERLLVFLKERLADPNFKNYLTANNGALAEIHESIKEKKRSTLTLLAKHHMLSMIQRPTEDDLGFDTEARTAEQVGYGHQDNNKGQLDLDSYVVDTRDLDEFISATLGYTDDLINQLVKERKALQATEFQAVEDLIDYQNSVEHQNEVLSTYIELWTNHVADAEKSLSLNEEESAACHDRANYLSTQLEEAQADYEEKEAAYQTTRKSLESTHSAIQEILELYIKKVVSAPKVYLEKIDEELARAEPKEPEPVVPLSSEEKHELVEKFEQERRAEEAREASIEAEEREDKREQAALERIENAIEQEIEKREDKKYEEAQAAVETIVQDLSVTELAREEADVARQAETEESELSTYSDSA